MHLKPAFLCVLFSAACSGMQTPEGYSSDGYGGAILSTGARGGASSGHGGSCGNGCSRGGAPSSAGGRALGGSGQLPPDSDSEAGAGATSAGTAGLNGGGGTSGSGSSKGVGGAGKSGGSGGKAALATGGSNVGGKASTGAGGSGAAGKGSTGRAGDGSASAGGASSAGDANNASAGSEANGAEGGTLGANTGGAPADPSGGQRQGGAPDEPTPFFSEYVEGSGSFKALEIAANALRELSGCQLEIYTNGSTKRWRSIELSGSVSREQVVVICSPELAAVIPVCSSSGGLSFTGNDVLLLSCSGMVVDAFGRLGEDPGTSGWGAPNGRTNDVTLRRRCDVVHGDAEPNDAFDPALEWSQASLDAFDDLGVFCAAP